MHPGKIIGWPATGAGSRIQVIFMQMALCDAYMSSFRKTAKVLSVPRLFVSIRLPEINSPRKESVP